MLPRLLFSPHHFGDKPVNGYICFYDRQQIEVRAERSYDAQQEAVKIFQSKTRKKVKGHQVTVVLAEKDGKEVVHTPS